MRCKRFGAISWLSLGLLLPGARLQALDPSQGIGQYAHSVWSRDNGQFPASVLALTQTPDGTVWIGTDNGLQQFDGVRFQAWRPPSGQSLGSEYVIALAPAGERGLWIGTKAGLSRWKDNQVRNYPTSKGPSGPVVNAILTDRAGTLWAGTAGFHTGGLCRMSGEQLQCGANGSALPDFSVNTIFQDRSGALWVGGFGLCRWTPGAAPDCSAADSTEMIHSIAQDQQGEIWAAGKTLKRLTSGRLTAYAPLRSHRTAQLKALLMDRDGGLWIGTWGQGLFHIFQGQIDRFGQIDGLSNDYVRSLLEDREGNIWVGTDGGLDRFREYAVTRISRREGLPDSSVNSVAASRDGGIWIGSHGGLTRFENGTPHTYKKDDGLPSGNVFGVFEEQAGRLWAFTLSGVAYSKGGRFRALELSGAKDVWIRAAAETPDHSVWLSDPRRGLIRLRDARPIEILPWSSFQNRQAWALAADPLDGGLWMGFQQGALAYYKDGHPVRWHALPSRLAGAPVTDLHCSKDGSLWLATTAGLGRLRNGKLDTLTASNGLPCNGIRALVEDGKGSLWLNTDCGLVSISAAGLSRWSDRPGSPLSPRLLDTADGMRGAPRSSGYFRQAAKSNDGRLWFVALDGAAVVNPAHLPENRIPPPVRIEEIVAGTTAYPAGSGLKLPPYTRELRINYTALSFVAPDKVRFRYRLAGFDRDWKDAAASRQAVYTNLPPRQYQFRVIACNNDGVWNQAGASLDFQIQPAFYQRSVFQAVCLVCAALLLWAGYRMRLRQMRGRLSIEFETQMRERTRIAREMHDSLLQELSGCALQLDGLTKLGGLPAALRENLREIRRELEKCARETREFLFDLRAPTLQELDLSQALRQAGEQITRGESIRFHVTVQGQPRPAPVKVQQQLLRIVQEATRNAVRYSRANEIAMDIAYLDSDQIRLQMRDDGCGFDLERAARESGHWGLHTMRERAEQLGGELRILTEPGRGTNIEVVVPIASAA